MARCASTSDSERKAGYYQEDKQTFDWIKNTTQTGNKRNPIVMFVELADDIAYACHDLEDAMRASFIGMDEIQAEIVAVRQDAGSQKAKALELLRKKLQEFSEEKMENPEYFRLAQKRTKSFFVDHFIKQAIALKSVVTPKMVSLDYSCDLKENLFFSASDELKDQVKGKRSHEVVSNVFQKETFDGRINYRI